MIISFKKVAALLLVFILAFSYCLPLSVSAEQSEYSVTDAELALLKKLDIVSEEDEQRLVPEDLITRGEFTQYVCDLLNLDVEFDASGEMPFRDVEASHKNYNSIWMLYNMNVVNGKSKYIFAPDEHITVVEGTKILLTAMGYQPIAEGRGGFPSGYLTTAVSCELLDRGNTDTGRELTVGETLHTVYNALFVDEMIRLSYGNEVELEKGSKMLESIYDVTELTGKVEETYTSSFRGMGNVKENQVKIDGTLYEFSDIGIDSAFGRVVTYYVLDKGSFTDEVIHYYEDDRYNDITVVSSEDIEDETSKEKIVYLDANDKKREIDVSGAADVVVNEMGKPEYTAEDLKPSFGKLETNDTDGDGCADVIFVTKYTLIAVENILLSEDNLIISNYLGSKTEIDRVSADCIIKAYKNSAEIQLSEIAVNNVLYMEDSGVADGRRLIKFTVSDKEVSGTLEEVNKDNVTIGGERYDVCTAYDINGISSRLGNDVKAALTPDGEVGYIRAGGSGTPYAYLYAAANTGIKDYNDEVSFRLLLEDNTYKTYRLADKVKLNDETKNPSRVYDAVAPGGKTTQQLIRYGLNGNDEIVKVDTAAVVTDDENETALRNEDTFRMSYSRLKRYFLKRSNSMLGGPSPANWINWLASGSAKVVVRPIDDNPDEDDVYMTDYSYFKDMNKYICEGYDVSKDGFVGAVVVYVESGSETVTRDQNFLVVDEICEMYDEKEEKVVPALAAYEKGVRKLTPVVSRDVLQRNGVELKRGDIVRVLYDKKGRIKALEDKNLKFSVTDNLKQYYTDSTSVVKDAESDVNLESYPYYTLIIGEVVDISGSLMKVRVKDTDDGSPAYIKAYLYATQPYVVYSKARGSYKLRVGSQADLSVGDIVIQRTYYTTPWDCVIYKLD